MKTSPPHQRGTNSGPQAWPQGHGDIASGENLRTVPMPTRVRGPHASAEQKPQLNSAAHAQPGVRGRGRARPGHTAAPTPRRRPLVCTARTQARLPGSLSWRAEPRSGVGGDRRIGQVYLTLIRPGLQAAQLCYALKCPLPICKVTGWLLKSARKMTLRVQNG